MKIIVTGSEGFIGSNLVEFLLTQGHEVVGIDPRNRDRSYHYHHNFEFINSKLSIVSSNIPISLSNVDVLVHLSANSDLITSDFEVDWEDTFNSTMYALKIRDTLDIPKFVFTSSSAVFGSVEGRISINHPHHPETYYGGFKSASESVIRASAFQKDFEYSIIRLANVVGAKYATHGVVYALFSQLKKDPTKLVVMGDGTHAKEYIHVDRVVDLLYESMKHPSGITQVGGLVVDQISVRDIVSILVSKLSVCPTITYTGKSWKGDVHSYSMEGSFTGSSLLDIMQAIDEMIVIYGGV